MDILASVLSTAAVTGSVAATVRAGDSWGIVLDRVPGAAFHAITSGSAHLVMEGRAPVRLMPGDTVLLPSGAPHELLSHPGAPTRAFDHLRAEAALGDGGELVVGEPPLSTQIICASYAQDPGARLSPFNALPPVVYVPALAAPTGLRSSLSLIADELSVSGPGIRSVLDHAVNIILIQMLRAWINDAAGTERPRSWLNGLADPVTNAALTQVHEDPAHPWTITTLAQRVGVSRATLARRFESEVGQTPGDYITSWRMELAAQKLRRGDETVGVIARGVGYRSEYAFNRAFARRYGAPPGTYRRTARAALRRSEHT
jgi:AraC-like DNA-binding protein